MSRHTHSNLHAFVTEQNQDGLDDEASAQKERLPVVESAAKAYMSAKVSLGLTVIDPKSFCILYVVLRKRCSVTCTGFFLKRAGKPRLNPKRAKSASAQLYLVALITTTRPENRKQ